MLLMLIKKFSARLVNKLVIRAGGTVETKSDLVAEGLVQAGDVTVNADDSGLVEGLTNTAWTPEIADQQ